RRLVGLVRDVEAYSLRSGMQRVIGYLLGDIDQRDDLTPPIRIVLDTSKGVIASRLNLTPEHFSRILGELSQEKLISVKGAEITILARGGRRAAPAWAARALPSPSGLPRREAPGDRSCRTRPGGGAPRAKRRVPFPGFDEGPRPPAPARLHRRRPA